MTFLLKDPDAALDYGVDWGADYLTQDSLAESQWSVTPDELDGVAVTASHFDLTTATVEVAAGRPGHVYRLTNHVVMASGREDSRSIMVRVDKR